MPEKTLLTGIEIKRKTVFLIPAALITLLCISAARPWAGRETVKISAPSRDIIALVDVSASMRARDLKPNRIVFVRHKLLDLISLLQTQSVKSRLAIISFSDDARLSAPMTGDFSVLPQFINVLNADESGQRAPSLEKALLLAADLVERGVTQNPFILIFSDGNFQENDSYRLTGILTEHRLKAGIIVTGSSDGTPLELDNGKFLKDSSGNILLSKTNDRFLREVAEKSGGYVSHATITDDDLEKILSSQSSALQTLQENVQVLGELGPWLLIAVLILCLASFATGNPKALFPAMAGIFFMPSHIKAEDETLYEARSYYDGGQYEDAARVFEQHLEQSPENPDILQALGSANYKKGAYALAEKYFRQLADSSIPPKQKYEAFFDLGNSLVMQKEFDAAIEAYRSALSIKPGDTSASTNLAYAERLKLEVTLTPTPTPSAGASSSSENKESQEKTTPSQNNNQKSSQNSSEQTRDSGNEQSSSPSGSLSSAASRAEPEAQSAEQNDDAHGTDQRYPVYAPTPAPAYPTPSRDAPGFAKDKKNKSTIVRI